MEELKMSLFLLGWKYETKTNMFNLNAKMHIWHSEKNDIIQIKKYKNSQEISYFKNWPTTGVAYTDIESTNSPDRILMHTYKEALILAELRT